MVASQVTRGDGTSEAKRAMKSSGSKITWVAIAVGRLQRIFDVALGREREPFDRHGRTRDITCHSLQFIPLVRLGRNARMPRKAGRFRQGFPGAIPGQRREALQHEGFAAFMRTDCDAVLNGVALQIFQHRILALPLRIQGQVAAPIVSH